MLREGRELFFGGSRSFERLWGKEGGTGITGEIQVKILEQKYNWPHTSFPVGNNNIPLHSARIPKKYIVEIRGINFFPGIMREKRTRRMGKGKKTKRRLLRLFSALHFLHPS